MVLSELLPLLKTIFYLNLHLNLNHQNLWKMINKLKLFKKKIDTKKSRDNIFKNSKCLLLQYCRYVVIKVE
ncbi:unnamed protein product [Tenebrio molitor]|nr:unnamed protein product [Tenebrio molitor]